MSPSPCDVSVVTVNWNGRHHLEKLLPSLAPTGCGETIVVDNGSSDGSVDFVRTRFPHVRVIENESNLGFAQPCNAGAKAAELPYVAFINNDMRADSEWIRNALPFLDDKTVCVASRILDWEGVRVDFNGSSFQYLGYATQQDIGRLVEEASHDETVLFPCGGAMLIERAVFLEQGGFDDDFFAIFEDVDLGWRLWIAGYRVAMAPESIVCHRGHATFDTQRAAKVRYLMHRNALQTVLKNYQEETFQSIFPVSLVLGIRRAVHFSGAAKDSFYLWSTTQEGLAMEDPDTQARVLDALNHLVALDDVLESLPSILQKRRRIQAGRRREDAEIFHLFKDPFRLIVDDPEYALREMNLLERAGFGSLLQLDQQAEAVSRLPRQLSDRITDLRRQLAALQWSSHHHRQRPRQTGGRLSPGQLLRVLRHNGVRLAWRRLVDHVEHGI